MFLTKKKLEDLGETFLPIPSLGQRKKNYPDSDRIQFGLKINCKLSFVESLSTFMTDCNLR